MVFKDACDCCGLKRPYLVFEGMADLSGCSINIRHKGILQLLDNKPQKLSRIHFV
jgi:hypothetical protein